MRWLTARRRVVSRHRRAAPTKAGSGGCQRAPAGSSGGSWRGNTFRSGTCQGCLWYSRTTRGLSTVADRASRRGCADASNTRSATVDKPVETVDSPGKVLCCRGGAGSPRFSPGRSPRPASSPGLGWSGDPGVLPVRHAVERARAATRLVSPLPRGADGAPARHAGRRPAMERAGWPDGRTRGSRLAAQRAAAAAGRPVDRGAPGRRAASAPRPPVPGPHPALRSDPALGFGRPR